ncbi:hypothetical protein BaRGS_00007879 [Batillaria attramentaria]|uniref:Uncharacterized protein n=1 Tax=Batillaria attramentaria TaxID=370345 RepID=A0ABD0LNH0_9CAEN
MIHCLIQDPARPRLPIQVALSSPEYWRQHKGRKPLMHARSGTTTTVHIYSPHKRHHSLFVCSRCSGGGRERDLQMPSILHGSQSRISPTQGHAAERTLG